MIWMIWQCADCGHQVIHGRRPAACRFCGPDVEFFVSRARKAPPPGRCVGHTTAGSARSAALAK